MKNTKKVSAGLLATLVATSSFGVAPKQAAAYTSGEKLDNHVIFQSFSLYQPYDSNMYRTLAKKGDLLNSWGVTDVWMPPAYRSFDMARYMEGYAIADRYDLGEFPQGPGGTTATKYGKASHLEMMVDMLHDDNIKVQMDLVPNQMLGLNKREAVFVRRATSSGELFTNPYTGGQTTKTLATPYLAYTKGGGQGQEKYGYLKEWNKTFLNGTSLQGQGTGRVMTDKDGKPYRYFGPENEKNYLPEWLIEASKTQNLNVVDTYLAADGWYEVSPQNWKPMLSQYAKDPGYLAYMKENGFETKEALLASADNGTIAKLTEEYMKTQATYGYGTEERSYQNDNSGIDIEDQFLFVDETGFPLQAYNKTMTNNDEFLLGVDLANSNTEVIKEQKNWMKWMLETYKFDGFRIDAASHYDTAILKAEAQVAKEHFGKKEHLSYIESYKSEQKAYMKANNDEQLIMDSPLYFTMRTALGNEASKRPLSAIATGSTINRAGNGSTDVSANWSFVNNHDQEKNRVNQIMLDLYGIKTGIQYKAGEEPKSFEKMYDKDTEKQALGIYNAELASTKKKYSVDNVVSQYAFLLTNKDTVPTVYYGDLYQTDASYMSKQTPYYDEITNLLKVRKQYAYGAQKVAYHTTNTSKVAGSHLISSVRLGKDRNTGVATVIGKKSTLNTTIKVDMGKQHTNQVFVDASGVTQTKLVTDKNGILTVPVKGMRTAEVNGYLGVFVPQTTKAPTATIEKASVYQGKGINLKTKVLNTSSTVSSIRYQVADTSKATVDTTGRLVGKASGKTTVTATVTLKDGFVLTTTLPIETKVNEVKLKATQKTLKKGQTTTIGYASATDKIKSVSYASLNKKIATVNTKGQVKAVTKGTTSIRVTYTTVGNYKVVKTFKVIVK
ncbi:Dextransucrase [Exiguobacterium sibiricum 255-15]|uniref:dextransucrase n=1 Tax=Exiguobacterium sibiricum (strain DSM 17290 / CCUG 55495 / CIP 109462 / JCM 13490 / 255-15) TaxID=262543 RepID=B1YMN6_EXIS2|nr:glycoside hydrolase family 70 protein [Exiguobacterium sibiricum]ACB62096.1 Dextransucrase [Exiguobacterium sibiricum 255-15]